MVVGSLFGTALDSFCWCGVCYVDDYCSFLMTEFPGLALLALYYRWSQIGGLHIQGDGLAGERVSE